MNRKLFRYSGKRRDVVRGTYPIVRLFDARRVLVETSQPFSRPRQITILPLADGEVVYERI